MVPSKKTRRDREWDALQCLAKDISGRAAQTWFARSAARFLTLSGNPVSRKTLVSGRSALKLNHSSSGGGGIGLVVRNQQRRQVSGAQMIENEFAEALARCQVEL